MRNAGDDATEGDDVMIDYATTKPGDKLRITGMGAPGFAMLGDIVTVVSTNGKNRVDVRHDATGKEAYFALTCGAQRLEPMPAIAERRRDAAQDRG